MNLRQRIRKVGINCLPWSHYRGELEYLPISSRTLFRRGGIPIDILERELKEEKLLLPDEILLEVLKVESNLYRGFINEIADEDDTQFGLLPDDFTQEDYDYIFGGAK